MYEKHEKHIRDWLAQQFRSNISMSVKRNFLVILWRTFSFSIRRCRHLRASSYSVSEKAIKNTLLDNSEILKQYLEHF